MLILRACKAVRPQFNRQVVREAGHICVVVNESYWREGGSGNRERMEKSEKREHVSRKVIKATDNELERPCSYLQSINVIN